jgi:hypothetical protein
LANGSWRTESRSSTGEAIQLPFGACCKEQCTTIAISLFLIEIRMLEKGLENASLAYDVVDDDVPCVSRSSIEKGARAVGQKQLDNLMRLTFPLGN